MLKKVLALLSIFVIVFSLSVTTFAHSGGTDSKGGHYNSSTGEYHYHHGYSAHQHPGGVCPYDFDDKTNHSSTGITSSKNNSSDTFNMILGTGLAFGILIGMCLLASKRPGMFMIALLLICIYAIFN